MASHVGKNQLFNGQEPGWEGEGEDWRLTSVDFLFLRFCGHRSKFYLGCHLAFVVEVIHRLRIGQAVRSKALKNALSVVASKVFGRVVKDGLLH